MHLPQLSVLDTLMFALQCQNGPNCEFFNLANHIGQTVRLAKMAAEEAGGKHVNADDQDVERFLELLNEVKDARGIQVEPLARSASGMNCENTCLRSQGLSTIPSPENHDLIWVML